MDTPEPEQIAVAANIDAAYYLNANADVRAAGLDPANHYCEPGWREGRDPAAWFRTADYLASNPDVRAAGINPFWHYLVQGRAEGRAARAPGGAWQATLQQAMPPDERPTVRAVAEGTPVLDPALLRDIVERDSAFARGLVVSVSHDRYPEVPGGTQLLIADEQRKFNGDNAVYLHLSPVEPRLGLAPAGGEAAWLNVILDGHVLGIVTAEAVTAALDGICGALPRLLVVHTLHGHRPEDIAALAAALRPRRAIYWVHDYGAICPSPRLLRNDIAFCHAPPVSSMACRVCVYGRERAAQAARLRRLAERVPLHVVAPSPSALALWQRASAMDAAATHVHPHVTLLPSQAASPPREGPVRVAFVGHAAFHKGWDVFRELVASQHGSGAYRFFQIASTAELAPLEGLTGIAADTNAAQPFGMSRALAAHGIDLVLALSPWPETFGYVAHEALAAGADLIATTASGNIADLVRDSARGLLLADAAAVLDCFASQHAARHALARRAAPPPALALHHTGSTATLALDGRAAATGDADLHVLADGVRVAGVRSGGIWRFSLPASGGAPVRLRSRHAMPLWSPAPEADRRRLGVAVSRLMLNGREIGLDDPRLGPGWHAPEAAWRWTDGDAALEAGGARVLQVSVAPILRYWRAPLLAA